MRFASYRAKGLESRDADQRVARGKDGLVPGEHDESREQVRQRTRDIVNAGDATLRALGYPTGFLRDRFAFLDDANEWRRLFAEVLGTFFLVFVAVGGGMVNARFGWRCGRTGGASHRPRPDGGRHHLGLGFGFRVRTSIRP